MEEGLSEMPIEQRHDWQEGGSHARGEGKGFQDQRGRSTGTEGEVARGRSEISKAVMLAPEALHRPSSLSKVGWEQREL